MQREVIIRKIREVKVDNISLKAAKEYIGGGGGQTAILLFFGIRKVKRQLAIYKRTKNYGNKSGESSRVQDFYEFFL